MGILTVSGDVFPLMGRENEYNWTEPYMISRQVVAVNRSSDIYRLSDLEGKTIAVQSTTKPESIFLERTDSRIPLVREVYSLEDSRTALHLLSARAMWMRSRRTKPLFGVHEGL